MGTADMTSCPADPHGGGLPWSERIPQAIGLFALCVGFVLALQRHEFTHPNLGLLAIGIVTLPWILDLWGEPRLVMRERRFGIPLLVGWSVVVLAGIMWLVAGYPVSNDFAPFLITLLVGEMTATAGLKFGAVLCTVGIGLLVTYSFAYNARGMYIWAFAFTFAWMGGAGFRRQVEITFDLSQAQTKLSEQAVEEERHRLAR
ncbi:MAG: hypothetical protein ACYDD6_02835, partial [Acidimicrobiales bacterium]